MQAPRVERRGPVPRWRARRATASVTILVTVLAASILPGCAEGGAVTTGSTTAATDATRPQTVFHGAGALVPARPGSRAATMAALFGSGFVAAKTGDFGADNLREVPGRGPFGGPVLQVFYPARSASGSVARAYHVPQGGAQVFLLLPGGPVDAATLRYCVRFPTGFDFVKGGKLPGLFGGTVVSGLQIPDGSDGWSTRFMWRAGGAGEVYAYLPTSVRTGTSLGRGDWYFVPGQWQCVTQTVRLNTPGRSDGSVVVDVGGRIVYRNDALEFRSVPTLRINGLFFSTFFGGGDPSWATPRDQYADFADFSVTTLPAPR